MRHHPRLPAAAILAAFALLGGLYAAAPALRRALAPRDAGSAAAAGTWFARAEALRAAGDPARAAEAYARVLEREPYHREARFRRAWCLAAAGDKEAFYAVMSELAVSDAKLAVDLFEAPVAKAWLAEPRFAELVKEARAQSLD
jgi:tetratricopeptide (TPR) repeat protein